MSLNLIKRTVLECVLTYIVFMILSWLIIDRVIIKHSEIFLFLYGVIFFVVLKRISIEKC